MLQTTDRKIQGNPGKSRKIHVKIQENPRKNPGKSKNIQKDDPGNSSRKL
jgi:hypothetical protein